MLPLATENAVAGHMQPAGVVQLDLDHTVLMKLRLFAVFLHTAWLVNSGNVHKAQF